MIIILRGMITISLSSSKLLGFESLVVLRLPRFRCRSYQSQPGQRVSGVATTYAAMLVSSFDPKVG